MAHACGFELAGVVEALSSPDFARFEEWRAAGFAGEMDYLNDRRGDLRSDPRALLPSARTILCVGKLYQTSQRATAENTGDTRGWISRFAWGRQDYHDVMRERLQRLLAMIRAAHHGPMEAKICVDTAPLLERSYARAAGLGWIGKNTCLIHERQGSWFFLGEILLSIPLLTFDAPPPDRCGTCRRCIDACPTDALVPNGQGEWTLDARLCISYLTIEKRGESPENEPPTGNHLFGCDICQDVCPWNKRAPDTQEDAFQPAVFAPPLEEMAALSEEEFRAKFRGSPVWRAKYEGFLRNVARALGQSKNPDMKKPLQRLAKHENAVVARTAQKALQALPVILLALIVAVGRGLASDVPVSLGYDHFYNNEFDEALTMFESDLKTHPQDPQMFNHVAQGILYREMLRSGALESQMVSGNNPFLRRPKMEISDKDKQRFAYCFDQAVKISDEMLRKNPNDLEALAALSVAHGLKSNYLFLVEKSWIDSLKEATAARKANERIRELDPKDADAKLVYGLNEYVVGSLPFYMRALGSIGGFHGDRNDGIQQLEIVARHGVRNRYDAQVLLAVIYRRERDPKKAIPLLKELAARFPRNYLFRLEQVQMYSDAGDKKSALAVLAEVDDLRKARKPGYANLTAEKLLYFRGNLLFWYNDLPGALADLQQATQKAGELDLNTEVLAWLRLGQVEDLQGRHTEAIPAYREAIKVAPKSEPAVEARGYLSTPYHRKEKA
jgi:epoxyqueuosine reductase